ncbi:urea transporter [Candidatus Nitrosocosmicus agrestis]|jgi:urea transporter|uniref:urea transporter n=1 Tax=Candidatus Nitrosocosmicus agrestis TaxID=2563600 RepID=UPI00122E0671|nr:urea transporter [Candidatus Nitrosocosmicus sp. SS]KAA2283857.1 urea transporter [Candidatus Nitrosocosmicus sp. SS]KAF0870233.1 urea transporter [Candidatus Nitrosocosmicus sp. SS]MDR4489416.1 urea transporter [Candidatus Nitrosocosmicus sp.]
MGIPTYSSGDPLLDFFYILFNGISEIPLLSSPITGIFILAGVLIASRKAGIMMVAAGLIGAGTALLLGADYGLVTFGLFGYNSILTGMAFWSGPFVKANRVTLTISIFGAIITAVAWMAFSHFMGDIFSPDLKGGVANSVAIPGFTSSFIFTTWAMMYASKRYGHDVWPEVPESVKEVKISGSDNPVQLRPDNFKWTPKEFIIATFKGVSQVTFVENWKTGVFWVVGLTLTFELAPLIAGVQDRPWFTNGYTSQWNEYSPLFLGGLMALIGSAIGAALSILMKLPTQETRIGLHGFNQVLVMIALTSFVPLTWQSFLLAVLATVACSVIVMPALQRFFGQWGLPALTGPFVFTAWVWLIAIFGFGNIPAGIGWSRPEG